MQDAGRLTNNAKTSSELKPMIAELSNAPVTSGVRIEYTLGRGLSWDFPRVGEPDSTELTEP